MEIAAGSLLERYRIFRSRDAEETRAFLRNKHYQFDIPGRQVGELDACLNGIYLPGLYIGYVQYGGVPVELAPGVERSDYWIQLPIRGQLEATINGQLVACDPSRAAIAAPMHERCRFISNADSARIQLALTGTVLIGTLTALLGEPPRVPLDFSPELDLTTGYGQSLARYVLMAAVDLSHSGSALLNPITTKSFEQMIMTALLLSHPHNYSAALRLHERTIATRDVKRVIDYVEAHLASAVTLADLVEASGVPGRTLFKHFRDSKGITPMRYVRNARFRKVREALMRAQPGETVTAIATSWGFSHMGRFAVDYFRHFGESPSETLREQRPGSRRRAVREMPATPDVSSSFARPIGALPESCDFNDLRTRVAPDASS